MPFVRRAAERHPGIIGILWGLWLLTSTQRPEQVLSAIIWSAGAVVVHDFVWVPALELLRRAREARRWDLRQR